MAVCIAPLNHQCPGQLELRWKKAPLNHWRPQADVKLNLMEWKPCGITSKTQGGGMQPSNKVLNNMSLPFGMRCWGWPFLGKKCSLCARGTQSHCKTVTSVLGAESFTGRQPVWPSSAIFPGKDKKEVRTKGWARCGSWPESKSKAPPNKEEGTLKRFFMLSFCAWGREGSVSGEYCLWERMDNLSSKIGRAYFAATFFLMPTNLRDNLLMGNNLA